MDNFSLFIQQAFVYRLIIVENLKNKQKKLWICACFQTEKHHLSTNIRSFLFLYEVFHSTRIYAVGYKRINRLSFLNNFSREIMPLSR